MLLNTGMRLPKIAVRAAPSLAMAMFQHRNEITEAPAPRYSTIPAKDQLQFIVAPMPTSSNAKGSSMIVPIQKVLKR